MARDGYLLVRTMTGADHCPEGLHAPEWRVERRSLFLGPVDGSSWAYTMPQFYFFLQLAAQVLTLSFNVTRTGVCVCLE